MDKFPEQIAFRCKSEDRSELKRISASLGVAESDVARVALKEGLRGIRDHGLRPVQAEEPR